MMTRHAAPALLAPVLLAAALLTAPAAAQETGSRGPSLQTLTDLAAALGEAHAVRTLCNGDGDQTWRVYMQNLLDLEAPGGARKSQLTAAFNRGYRVQNGRGQSCTADMRNIEADIARRGRILAESAAGSYLQ